MSTVNQLDVLLTEPHLIPNMLDTVGWNPEICAKAFARKDFREELLQAGWALPQAYQANVEEGCRLAGFTITWDRGRRMQIRSFEEVK